MKNIFKIHPFFYLFSFVFIFNGLIKDFIYILVIILFHELGHIIMGIYYKWKIEKIIILPFGSLTLFNHLVNVKLKEEFFVTLMGPLFQIILFLIKIPKFTYYNKLILLFNLIPIIPLDGSKILNIILNKIFSFQKSNNLLIIISFVISAYLLIYYHSLISILIISLLLKKVLSFLVNKRYIFNLFLLERYLYKISFKRAKIVSKTAHMKRDYHHLFLINKKYYLEREILAKMFDK